MLQKLRASSRRLAVVTAEERGLMDFNLETLGLKEYFDVLVFRDDALRPKPDPEEVRIALRSMKTQPGDSLMIGDAVTDILAGKNAGVLTGLAEWFPQFQGDLAKAKPDYRFETVEHLAKFFA